MMNSEKIKSFVSLLCRCIQFSDLLQLYRYGLIDNLLLNDKSV